MEGSPDPHPPSADRVGCSLPAVLPGQALYAQDLSPEESQLQPLGLQALIDFFTGITRIQIPIDSGGCAAKAAS